MVSTKVAKISITKCKKTSINTMGQNSTGRMKALCCFAVGAVRCEERGLFAKKWEFMLFYSENTIIGKFVAAMNF